MPVTRQLGNEYCICSIDAGIQIRQLGVVVSNTLKSKIMKKALVGFYLVFLVSFQVVAQKDVDPLQAAIAAKNLTLLKEVIANGGKVNQTFEFIFTSFPASTLTLEKATPLLYAMDFGWYEGVLELLRAGAKPNAVAKVDKLNNFRIQNCSVKEIDSLSPIFVAIYLNNIDFLKLLIIAGADTRGMNTVKFSHECRAYGNQKNGIVYLREYATEQAKELLKAGKKADWAANGLPAEGQRPL